MQKYRKLQLADFFLQLYHKLLESATYSSAGDSERIVNHGSSRSHGDNYLYYQTLNRQTRRQKTKSGKNH